MKKLVILFSILIVSCSSETIDIEPLTVKEKIVSISSVWKMVETTPHSDVYLSFPTPTEEAFNLIVDNNITECYLEVLYVIKEGFSEIIEDTDTTLKINVGNNVVWTFTVENDIVNWNIVDTGGSRDETFNPSNFDKTNFVNCFL